MRRFLWLLSLVSAPMANAGPITLSLNGVLEGFGSFSGSVSYEANSAMDGNDLIVSPAQKESTELSAYKVVVYDSESNVFFTFDNTAALHTGVLTRVTDGSFSIGSPYTFAHVISLGAAGNSLQLVFDDVSAGQDFFGTPFRKTPTADSWGALQASYTAEPDVFVSEYRYASAEQGTAVARVTSATLAADVPIPATLALVGLGFVGLGWTCRKKV
ncbi:PEP-CTERM sorting domain-containing protein [Congregibacter sp.]|nr:PEP-CTERM sorting domain-containing protein [Congregibacter sp.]MDA8962188.1 PEP-CTERM sorting domain-containing protein [Congregibacter sp.]